MMFIGVFSVILLTVSLQSTAQLITSEPVVMQEQNGPACGPVAPWIESFSYTFTPFQLGRDPVTATQVIDANGTKTWHLPFWDGRFIFTAGPFHLADFVTINFVPSTKLPYVLQYTSPSFIFDLKNGTLFTSYQFGFGVFNPNATADCPTKRTLYIIDFTPTTTTTTETASSSSGVATIQSSSAAAAVESSSSALFTVSSSSSTGSGHGTCIVPQLLKVEYETPDGVRSELSGDQPYNASASSFQVINYNRPTADGKLIVTTDVKMSQITYRPPYNGPIVWPAQNVQTLQMGYQGQIGYTISYTFGFVDATEQYCENGIGLELFYNPSSSTSTQVVESSTGAVETAASSTGQFTEDCVFPTQAVVEFTDFNNQTTLLQPDTTFTADNPQWAYFSYERPVGTGHISITFNQNVSQMIVRSPGQVFVYLEPATQYDLTFDVVQQNVQFSFRFHPINSTGGLCGNIFEIDVKPQTTQSSSSTGATVIESPTGVASSGVVESSSTGVAAAHCIFPTQAVVEFTDSNNQTTPLQSDKPFTADNAQYAYFSYQRPAATGRISITFNANVSELSVRSPGLVFIYSQPATYYDFTVEEWEQTLQLAFRFHPINETYGLCGNLFEFDFVSTIVSSSTGVSEVSSTSVASGVEQQSSSGSQNASSDCLSSVPRVYFQPDSSDVVFPIQSIEAVIDGKTDYSFIRPSGPGVISILFDQYVERVDTSNHTTARVFDERVGGSENVEFTFDVLNATQQACGIQWLIHVSIGETPTLPPAYYSSSSSFGALLVPDSSGTGITSSQVSEAFASSSTAVSVLSSGIAAATFNTPAPTQTQQSESSSSYALEEGSSATQSTTAAIVQSSTSNNQQATGAQQQSSTAQQQQTETQIQAQPSTGQLQPTQPAGGQQQYQPQPQPQAQSSTATQQQPQPQPQPVFGWLTGPFSDCDCSGQQTRQVVCSDKPAYNWFGSSSLPEHCQQQQKPTELQTCNKPASCNTQPPSQQHYHTFCERYSFELFGSYNNSCYQEALVAMILMRVVKFGHFNVSMPLRVYNGEHNSSAVAVFGEALGCRAVSARLPLGVAVTLFNATQQLTQTNLTNYRQALNQTLDSIGVEREEGRAVIDSLTSVVPVHSAVAASSIKAGDAPSSPTIPSNLADSTARTVTVTANAVVAMLTAAFIAVITS